MSPDSNSKGNLLTRLYDPQEQKRHYLMVGYKSGCIMLMHDENDKEPILFLTSVIVHRAKWNNNGDILAVCGPTKNTNSEGNFMIEFYSNAGQILKVIPLMSSVSAISFDGNGLRLGFSSDQAIFFCNVKQEYCYT